MTTATAPVRLGMAALLALLLAIRVVASAGYMPEIEHGQLTLMLCPDGEWTAPATAAPAMAGMTPAHGPKQAHHQQCPYAVAAATPLASGDSVPLLPLPLLIFAVSGTAFLFTLRRRSSFERPFSTGPPLSA